MDAVERHAELDGVTEEDVAAGNLNDDQAHALRSFDSLEAAQDYQYCRIAAVCADAPRNVRPAAVARVMYDLVCEHSHQRIEEPDDIEGLIVP